MIAYKIIDSLGFDSGKFFKFSPLEHFQVMLKIFNGVFKDGFWLIEWFDINKILIIKIHVLKSIHNFSHFLLFVGLLLLFRIVDLLRLSVVRFAGFVGLFTFLFACHFNLIQIYIQSIKWLIIDIDSIIESFDQLILKIEKENK